MSEHSECHVMTEKMTNYRWTICIMMFLALTINYLDRQVLSLTWDEFIKPEFHWNEAHYGIVTATFSIVYAIGMLFAGRLIDWLGTKRGYLWSIGIWSAGACLHAFCGIATEAWVGLEDKAALLSATGDMAVVISTVSMYFFLAARCVLAIGEAGYFPVAVKVTAEYFPKRDRAFATSIFNAGASIGALIAPLTIPYIAKAVDPYLSLFRSDKARIGALDFSPVIAVGILSVIESLLNVFGIYGTVTFGIILSQIILAFWSYGVSIFLWISIIMLIFRTIASFSSNPAFYNMQSAISFTNPIINFVRRCFGARIVKDRTLNIVSLIVAIMLYFVLKRVFGMLAAYALRIPF